MIIGLNDAVGGAALARNVAGNKSKIKKDSYEHTGICKCFEVHNVPRRIFAVKEQRS
jgi:hypothetical protein